MAPMHWRPPTRADDEDWARLLAAMEAVDRRGETYELEDLADEWDSVWSRPSTDSVFVWDGADLVAFGWLKTQVGVTKEHRIACWGGVHPAHRGRGIGRELLTWQLRRASEVAAGLDPALATRVNLDAEDRQRDLLALAARLGFTPVRRFLEVARPVDLPLTQVPAPAGLELVPWSEAIDAAVRLAHADSFADHWGSEPRTEEEWRQWYTGHRSFRPDLTALAIDAATGEVAALVLTAAYPQDWVHVPVEAWINTVGTRRAWRGNGAARWVLTEVLDRIAQAGDGFERAILGVDAENPTGALGLYRSLGFDDVRVVSTLSRGPLV